MNADRTQTCRLIDYSAKLKFDGATALQVQIARLAKGIRGPRINPVTEKQILAWFRSTPSDFVRIQITEACFNGEIRACSRSLSSSRLAKGVCVYEATA